MGTSGQGELTLAFCKKLFTVYVSDPSKPPVSKQAFN